MPHQVRDDPDPSVDLDAPFTSDIILEVRTGRMKPMPGLTVQSGIDKTLRDGPVRVTDMGLEGDEHDPTFHGGLDKAIHGYCSSHYPTWRTEFPSAAASFQPGAFGENLVTARLNERNLCIGDIVSISPPQDQDQEKDNPLLLQVSLPRQPCFKLNHRFQLKNFAPNTWKTSRTGWYFRVLRPGTVRAGDTIRLVERRHPAWTLERVQEYLHRDTADAAMNETLAGIEALGAECRDAFRGRVVRQRRARERREREQKGKGKGKGKEQQQKWREFRVVERVRETARVVAFVLEAVEPLVGADAGGEEEVELRPGAHAKIRLGNGLVRAYSVVDGDRNRFRLGVALDEKSRGGSSYLHETAQIGHTLQVGAITAAVPLAGAASHHIFVAGGVGITAFLALVERYKLINFSVTLHYAVRSAEEVPFRERLARLGDHVVVIHDKAAGQRLDIRRIIEDMPWNSQLYFCGPQRLMDEAARETKAHGIAEKEVHFEAFSADLSGDPFEVVVANKGGKTIQVGEEETLLECLQKEFDDVDSSCAVGNCGTCRVTLKDGRVDHRGTALTEAEKATSMLACLAVKMPSGPTTIGDFSVLPVSIPPLPSFPRNVVHYLYVRRNAPKIPTATDARSLFLTNVPVDSTEAHFRALFASLVGAGRFESAAFEDERKDAHSQSQSPFDAARPAHAARLLQAHSKKRKREDEEAERAREEAAARLPSTWTRPLRKSGSTAVVLLADEKSVEQVLKAIGKVHKTKKYPAWGGDNLPEGKVPPLGSIWLKSHNRLSYPDKGALQASVDAFSALFARREQEAAEIAKRLRNEPDEDGFVTVTRGGRAATAGRNEAEEAKRKMLERQEKKKEELTNFYRFQLRERKKEEQAELLKRFDDDRRKLEAMRVKRGKFIPEA
ncbi:vanillate o-demethylase [Chaetomidium leptoderma]|uniref:Vanillate o-demethylase n=1 Tax=Chaetomidium leptoderma TaxID=669021 RepID=A0AAN6VL44_9PEZI|nr:vanillate o-demethylase [Chaetomidium leptoderma]